MIKNRIHILRNPATLGFDFYWRQSDGISIPAYLSTISFEHLPDDPSSLDVPHISIPEDVAQQIMNELWMQGVKPADGGETAGALSAMKDHLSTVKGFADRLLTLIERNYDGA